MPSHPRDLPHGAVVAIGICVPVFFFLVLTLVFLYCYLRIQNRHSHKKRSRRHRRWKEKSAIEPHHGWPQDSTARIRPISYVPPGRTRYSNPLAQIVEQPSDNSDAGIEDPEKDPEKDSEEDSPRSLKQPRPPSGLTTWERRGVEDATTKNIRFSDSMNSTHNSTIPTATSASTTIIPSDGRRDSGESIDEEAEHRNRERQEMTPPPLFSIPETGSSTTFIPARSGSAWDHRDERDRPDRSMSRHSRRSEDANRSVSRGGERGEEPPRSVSRASRSHSRHSHRQSSIETRLEEGKRMEQESAPQSPRANDGLGLFRDVVYEPKEGE